MAAMASHDQIIDAYLDAWRKDGFTGLPGAIAAYIAWVQSGGCIIRTKSGDMCPMVFNRSQRIVLVEIIGQAVEGKPIRITVLKSRKTGVSTLVQTLFVFIACNYANQVGITMAHLPQPTLEVAEIAKTSARTWRPGVEVLTHTIRWPDVNSRLWYHTAGGASVAAGGTPSFMHLSEVALWRPPASKRDTYASSLEAVPYLPETIVVEESTARGREEFYGKWEAAEDVNHPYNQVFVPWFFDDDLSAIGTIDILDEEERDLVERARRYGVEMTDAMLCWRRMQIRDIGEAMFRREFPATPQEAVQASRGLVLPGLDLCVIDSDELPFDYHGTTNKHRCGGIDFGFADPTAILSGMYFDGVIYVMAVWHGAETLAKEQAEGLLSGHTYYCDPASLQARRELQAHNPNAYLIPAPRRSDGRYDATEIEWRDVAKMIREGRIKVLASCSEKILNEADNLFWNEKTGKPDMVRRPDTGHFDILDALRYWVAGIIQHEGLQNLKPTKLVSHREFWGRR